MIYIIKRAITNLSYKQILPNVKTLRFSNSLRRKKSDDKKYIVVSRWKT